MTMLRFAIENGMEQIDCPDATPCGYEHWRATGDRRPRVDIGPFDVPLPRFLLGYVQRKFEAMR